MTMMTFPPVDITYRLRTSPSSSVYTYRPTRQRTREATRTLRDDVRKRIVAIIVAVAVARIAITMILIVIAMAKHNQICVIWTSWKPYAYACPHTTPCESR
jgi:hypothetical protein